MPVRAAHILDLDAADPTDAGLRRVLALRRMAERSLVQGDANERAVAAGLLDYLDKTPEGGLEGHLGLSGPGHTGALRQYRQQRRDAALRGIWRACWPDLNPCAAARVIARHWTRCVNRWTRQSPAGSISADEPGASFNWLWERGHDVLSAETLRKVLSDERQKIGRLQAVETTTESGEGNT